MAWHNRLCYSKTYGMDTPKDRYEKEFANAVRDCEIVDELIAMVKEKEPPKEQAAPYEVNLSMVGKLIQQKMKDYVSENSPANMVIPTPDSSPEACAALKESLLKMLSEPIPHIITIDHGDQDLPLNSHIKAQEKQILTDKKILRSLTCPLAKRDVSLP